MTNRGSKIAGRTEAARLLAGIRALVRRFAVSERADVACCGMTVAQSATLEALRAGGMRIVDLGRRLGVSPSTLSRNLDRLEERGLVERRPDGRDARACVVGLTKAGRAGAARAAAGEVEFAGEVLGRLPSAERRAVVEALELLLRAVRGATEDCCPGAFDHLMADFPARRAARAPARKEPQP